MRENICTHLTVDYKMINKINMSKKNETNTLQIDGNEI